MTAPTRILLSDDLYALEEEMRPEKLRRFRRKMDHDAKVRAIKQNSPPSAAPGTEPLREMRPSPLLGFLAAGISGAVVGALLVLVLT